MNTIIRLANVDSFSIKYQQFTLLSLNLFNFVVDINAQMNGYLPQTPSQSRSLRLYGVTKPLKLRNEDPGARNTIEKETTASQSSDGLPEPCLPNLQFSYLCKISLILKETFLPKVH